MGFSKRLPLKSRRWRFGSCLIGWSLAIVLSQLIIHPVILQFSSLSLSDSLLTTEKASHPSWVQQQSPSSSSTTTSTTTTTSRRTQQVLLHLTSTKPDGYFNTIPIHFNNGSIPRYSTVHCVGETHDSETAWMFRSCHYQHLCFDTNTSDFVLLRSPMEQRHLNNPHDGIYLSSSLSSIDNYKNNDNHHDLQVALGGINPRWASKQGRDKGIHKVRWSPRILDVPSPSQDNNNNNNGAISYYELPDHVVLIPFHSFAAHNIGHLLWDDFLPIYNLLDMFDLLAPPLPQKQEDQLQQQQQRHQYLLLRKVLRHALYATCEKRPKKAQQCQANMERFLPAMGIDPATYSTTKDYKLQLVHPQDDQQQQYPRSSLVCTKHGVAGIGMLTDHGLVDHGWVPLSSATTTSTNPHHPHNIGRGPLLARFRDYLVGNLGLSPDDSNSEHHESGAEPPFQIVFSTNSSRNTARQLLFTEQIQAVQTALASSKKDNRRRVQVQQVTMSQLSLTEQVTLAVHTNVLITACGGGAVTATFLPRGSTLIVYYPEHGGFDFDTMNYTETPALLDWDLFNNMAHVKVHWFPIGTMNTPESIDTLLHVLQLEVNSISTPT